MYIKYIYWMKKKTFEHVQKKLENEHIAVREAKKTVCLPLSSKISFGFVPPSAWSKFDLCRRQLSWYGVSKFAGQYLLICDKPLTEFGLDFCPETIIDKSKFKPKQLPRRDSKKIKRLAESKAFKTHCPSEFLDIDNMEDGMQERWMKVMGVRGISYDELFVEQCANHSNFIEPEFYLEAQNGISPYSIGKTKTVCSACLQFFNIIGGRFKNKYVIPCPGAALFAGMAVNKYYRVQATDA